MAREDELKSRLSALAGVADDDIDPATASLLIAGIENPQCDLALYEDFLAEMRRAIADDAQAETVEERHRLLKEVMVDIYDFTGDLETYDDPANADLTGVIDRRRGLPVTLGILYLHLARTNGWVMHGLAFPRHFLVRLEDDAGRRLIFDPFYAARLVSPADMRGLLKELVGTEAELSPRNYADVGNRDVLLRLCGNIQLMRMRMGDLAGTLRILETALLFAPDESSLWREAGLTALRLGKAAQAVVALERFLTYPISASEREKVKIILKRLYEKPFTNR